MYYYYKPTIQEVVEPSFIGGTYPTPKRRKDKYKIEALKRLQELKGERPKRLAETVTVEEPLEVSERLSAFQGAEREELRLLWIEQVLKNLQEELDARQEAWINHKQAVKAFEEARKYAQKQRKKQIILKLIALDIV